MTVFAQDINVGKTIVTRSGEAYVFTFYLDGIIVSKAAMWLQEKDEFVSVQYVEISSVETIEKFRRHGYMEKLFYYMFEYAVEYLKVDVALLSVEKTNFSAYNLYFKIGFEVLSEHPLDDDYWVMTKDLFEG